MIQDRIEGTFRDGKRLPKAIAHICDFLDKHDYPISGCFELSAIGMDSMDYWFRNNPQAVDSLIPFGRGACGDVYCVWLTDNLPAESAPIVMFGSEGELSVLAKTSEDFCKLLCLGYSEVGLEDHSKPGDDFEKTEPFRSYIMNIYSFTLPDTGDAIINSANKAFPNFKEWEAKYAN
ncbi:hypothetical protein [Gilvimarinus polysaccharolyticus]|uniref:hypothetical protein n=1 Tax=Gilvimarinus polysaccharolyticus TaxID=863921 RepID=UPI0006731A7A|nr:hypothetical protein [Gilvimarinus polysaccharolyticus]